MQIDEDALRARIRETLEKITGKEDPHEMNQLKRIYRRSVPLHLRAYFSAYLLSLLWPSSTPSSDWSRLFVSVGKNRKVYPKDLQQLFIATLGIPEADLGEVKVLDNYSFVQIRASHAERAIAEVSGKELRGRKVTVNHARSRETKSRG